MSTVLLGYEGENTSAPDTATALITLNGNTAGIRGIRFFYSENNPENGVKAYPFTIRGNGSNVYAVNIGMTGVYNGIDFGTYRCDNHYIRKVLGMAYNNFIVVGASSCGWIEGCLSNGNAVCRCKYGISGWVTEGNKNLFKKVVDPITRPNEKFITVNGASDEHLLNNFAYGVKIGVFIKASKVNVFNLGTDNLGWGGYGIKVNSGSAQVMNFMRFNGSISKGNVTIFNEMHEWF